MSSVIDKIESAQRRDVPAFDPGDRVRVHFQVIEGSRRRTQVFEGFVIKRQGSGMRETFTVRKHSFGVGVERTFPVHSPKIEQIEVAARGEVRRAKLYYLRDRIGKAARVRERAWAPQDSQGSIEDAELVPPPEPEKAEADEDAATDLQAGDTPADTPAAEEPPAEEAAPEEPTSEEPTSEEPTADADAPGESDAGSNDDGDKPPADEPTVDGDESAEEPESPAETADKPAEDGS